MAQEQFANNASSTLSAGITSDQTTITVNSAASFSSSPQFRVLVDSELMLVTGVSGNTFTVTRAAEGTAATSHAVGAVVTQLITAGALTQIKADTTPVALANIAALTGLAGYDGALAYVQSVECPWRYVAAGTSFTVDHITVEATADGGATRWVREAYSSPKWRAKITDVYIDSVAGNDENQGIYTSTPGTPAPLKTWQELSRRWGSTDPVTGNGTYGVEIQVHIKNAITAPDYIDRLWLLGPDTWIRVLGENTATLHSGTLDGSTGFTAWVPSAASGGTPNIIKDSTGSLSWAPYIGKLVYFPRVNSYAVILKDLGSGRARISVPQFGDEANFNTAPSNVFPSNSDTYQIVDPVHVSVGLIEGKTIINGASVFGPIRALNFSAITFVPDTTADASAKEFRVYDDQFEAIAFYQCVVLGLVFNSNTVGGQVAYVNCSLGGVEWQNFGDHASGGGFCVSGGAIVDPNGALTVAICSGRGAGDIGGFDYYVHVQGASIYCTAHADLRSVAVFDAVTVTSLNPNGDAIVVGQSTHEGWFGGLTISDRGGIPIFGNGNAGVGIALSTNAMVTYETLPNITGSGGDFRLGDTGAARYFDETLGAYSAGKSTTWANLTASQPSGFGGHAHNPSENAHLIVID
ncbi:MAG TPA: hypothetical protein VMI75_28110 [Polyangiaceae bacterium]|nr:hypothetical protein [Polyangiaceae bacterium]